MFLQIQQHPGPILYSYDSVMTLWDVFCSSLGRVIFLAELVETIQQSPGPTFIYCDVLENLSTVDPKNWNFRGLRSVLRCSAEQVPGPGEVSSNPSIFRSSTLNGLLDLQIIQSKLDLMDFEAKKDDSFLPILYFLFSRLTLSNKMDLSFSSKVYFSKGANLQTLLRLHFRIPFDCYLGFTSSSTTKGPSEAKVGFLFSWYQFLQSTFILLIAEPTDLFLFFLQFFCSASVLEQEPGPGVYIDGASLNLCCWDLN